MSQSTIVYGHVPTEISWFRSIKPNTVFDVMIVGTELSVVSKKNKKFVTIYFYLQQNDEHKFLQKTFQIDNGTSLSRWHDFKAIAGLPQADVFKSLPGRNFQASVKRRRQHGKIIYDFIRPKS